MSRNKNPQVAQAEPQEEILQRFFLWALAKRLSPAEIAQLVGASAGWVTLARQGKIKSVRTQRRRKIMEILGDSQ